MALVLLNGTSAVPSVSVSSTTLDCQFGAWRAVTSSQKFDQRTFCSGGYRVSTKGIKAVDVACAGFLGKGVASADPLLYFGAATGVACIWQADTGCTLTGSFHIDPAFGIVAAGGSEESFACESTGTFSTTWVTS